MHTNLPIPGVNVGLNNYFRKDIVVLNNAVITKEDYTQSEPSYEPEDESYNELNFNH